MTAFLAGNRRLAASLARPDGDGQLPGVVVIHEVFGLNENIKDLTRRFAGAGYVALIVDSNNCRREINRILSQPMMSVH